MRVLALSSQKGGSGKTTLSGHLAVQAQRAGYGPVCLIDIDPQGSLADWSADPFDLTICYDVLQYLDDRTAARAIVNLGKLTRGVLYLSALTARDWRDNCDRTRTDRNVHLRSADWYGRRLRRYFKPDYQIIQACDRLRAARGWSGEPPKRRLALKIALGG